MLCYVIRTPRPHCDCICFFTTGNAGNLPLVLVVALLREAKGGAAPLAVAAGGMTPELAIAYISMGIWVGNLSHFTIGYNMLNPEEGGLGVPGGEGREEYQMVNCQDKEQGGNGREGRGRGVGDREGRAGMQSTVAIAARGGGVGGFARGVASQSVLQQQLQQQEEAVIHGGGHMARQAASLEMGRSRDWVDMATGKVAAGDAAGKQQQQQEMREPGFPLEVCQDVNSRSSLMGSMRDMMTAAAGGAGGGGGGGVVGNGGSSSSKKGVWVIDEDEEQQGEGWKLSSVLLPLSYGSAAATAAAAADGRGGWGTTRASDGRGTSSSSSSRSCSRPGSSCSSGGEEDGTTPLVGMNTISSSSNNRRQRKKRGSSGYGLGQALSPIPPITTTVAAAAAGSLPERLLGCLTSSQSRQYTALLPERTSSGCSNSHHQSHANPHNHQQQQEQQGLLGQLGSGFARRVWVIRKGFRVGSLGLGSWCSTLVSAPILACWVSLVVGATPGLPGLFFGPQAPLALVEVRRRKGGGFLGL